MTGLAVPPAQITVRAIDVLADGMWRMDSSRLSWSAGAYAASSDFDPFPAYPHDWLAAADAAAHVSSLVPPLWPVMLYIANREATARTNGYANAYVPQHYDELTAKWVNEPPQGLIVLSAKRIPPHPAMTRYLVAHEYGHNVEWMLNEARGAKSIHSPDLTAEYIRVRGLDVSAHHGTGGRWHDSPTEIFACDFRMLVLGDETEFWPHPGIPRPEDVPGLRDWWACETDRLTKARERADAPRTDLDGEHALARTP